MANPNPKNPYNAALDANQYPTTTFVSGSVGTSDTGGTAEVIRGAADPATGAQYVYNLGPAGSTTVAPNLPVIAGTPADPGTPITVRLTDGTSFYNAGAASVGTNNNIVTGTQQTLGTVGTVPGIGTITNIGSISNIGTMPSISANPASGTQQTLGTVGTVIGVGTISNVVTTSGTTTGVGTITNIGSISNIGTMPASTLVLNTGTLTTGSLSNVALVGSVAGVGTISNIVTTSGTTTGVGTVTTQGTLLGLGTLTNLGSVTNVGSIAAGVLTSLGTLTGAGTLTNLGSVTNIGTVKEVTTVPTVSNLTNGSVNLLTGTVTSVTNLAAGTVQINPTPVPTPLIQGTLGTAGGSFFGTLSAAAGAGTKHYISGLQVVVQSGTPDVRILAGSSIQGTGVLAAGQFVPSAGVVREFNPVFVTGTNSELIYHFVSAGTAFITVNYWKGV